MILSIISFTESGIHLSKQVEMLVKSGKIAGIADVRVVTKWSGAKQLAAESQTKDVADQYPPYVTCSLSEWTGEQMEKRRALLFIGACGIAVRAIAPYVENKLYDSPVLVADELGHFIIPILSGHMGGANELAMAVSGELGAVPVITTATDLNEAFAVDMFAKKQNLAVMNKDGIAKVSSKVLRGEKITMSVEPYPPERPVDIVVTTENRTFDASLILKPKIYAIGMGCRKGKEPEKIAAWIREILKEQEIPAEQIFMLASIDVKKEEPGLVSWAMKHKVPFQTYSAAELMAVSGEFQVSDFVQSQVGVENVCERAAIKACGDGGELILKKQAHDGMTIAIAKRTWSVNLDE